MDNTGRNRDDDRFRLDPDLELESFGDGEPTGRGTGPMPSREAGPRAEPSDHLESDEADAAADALLDVDIDADVDAENETKAARPSSGERTPTGQRPPRTEPAPASSSPDDRTQPAPRASGGRPDDLSTTPYSGASRPTPLSGQSQILDLPLRGNQVIAGKYRMEKRLGGGGFGEVWLARDLNIDEPVALKFLHPRASELDEFLRRFQREAKMMRQLEHARLVRLYDYVASDPPFLVMEYVKGQTLRDRMRQSAAAATPAETPGESPGAPPSPPASASSPRRAAPLPLPLIGRILGQLCDLLEVARAWKLVHRDLKPENLMLLDGRAEGAEAIKVLDLGISKRLPVETASTAGINAEESLTSSDSELPLCTPAYASPEQARFEPVDHRSDLYSVGVILYEMLCGQVPFRSSKAAGDTRGRAFDVLSQHLYKAPEPPSLKNPEANIPAGVEALVMRCLAKDPADRPQTASELWNEFASAAVASGVPVEQLMTKDDRSGSRSNEWPTIPGTTTPPPRPKPKPPTARTWLKPAALGLAGLLLAGLVWFVVSRNTSTKIPKKSDTVDPDSKSSLLPPTVATLLDRAGFEPVPDTSLTLDGWPKHVQRKANPERKFTWVAPQRYVPKGYKAEDPNDLVDGWPRRLVRDSSTADAGPVVRLAYIRVPGGTATIGKTEVDENGKPLPWSPEHQVKLDPYYLQETEVTNGELTDHYDKAKIEPNDRPAIWRNRVDELINQLGGRKGVMDRPAVGLTWSEADAYARAQGGALPTEAQWEHAARSAGDPDFAVFVWGGEINQSFTNQAHLDSETFLESPVAQYEKDTTQEGVRDLAGNVREWTRDWGQSYGSTPAKVDSNRKAHMIRGASYVDRLPQARVYFRNIDEDEPIDDSLKRVGFRLVLEPAAIDDEVPITALNTRGD